MNHPYTYGEVLKQIHDELEKNANNALRPRGLTMSQLSMMLVLRNRENYECTFKEMEKELHVAQSTTAGIAQRLEQKGLVESTGDPDDKRVKRLHLTQAGRDCCDEAEIYMEQTENKMASALTDVERELFYSLLVKIRDSLK